MKRHIRKQALRDPVRAAKIKETLRTTDKTQRQIARQFGVAPRTVYFHNLLVIRPKDRPEKTLYMRERPITEVERTNIERMVAGGSTFIAAAFTAEVSIRTVLKVIYGDDYFQKWEENDE